MIFAPFESMIVENCCAPFRHIFVLGKVGGADLRHTGRASAEDILLTTGPLAVHVEDTTFSLSSSSYFSEGKRALVAEKQAPSSCLALVNNFILEIRFGAYSAESELHEKLMRYITSRLLVTSPCKSRGSLQSVAPLVSGGAPLRPLP